MRNLEDLLDFLKDLTAMEEVCCKEKAEALHEYPVADYTTRASMANMEYGMALTRRVLCESLANEVALMIANERKCEEHH